MMSYEGENFCVNVLKNIRIMIHQVFYYVKSGGRDSVISILMFVLSKHIINGDIEGVFMSI